MSNQPYSAVSEGGMHLFACTRCNSRHPFEELSRRHQLCRACRSSFKVINCDYCRNEFKLELLGAKTASNVCRKCQQLQDQHGKPKACACCTIEAAFIGSRCQRCTNSEKKYGPPLNCENCKLKSAFDRPDAEGKSRVGGKMLCWLCTMDYKRSQAKSKHKEHHTSDHRGSSGGRHHRASDQLKPDKTNNNGLSANGHGTSNQAHQAHRSSGSHRSSNQQQQQRQHQHQQQQQQHSSSSRRHGESSSSPSKRPRLERSSIVEPHFMNQASSDTTAIVTQLKEQISQLNKRILIKEKELQTKDQQIADLKSTQTREQREMREKMSNLQRQHSDRTSELQSKLIALQKQIAAHTKAPRAQNSASGYVEPPLVI